MRKFKFKLEGLYKIKQAKERDVKHELMEIQSLCERQTEKIRDAGQKITDWSRYYNEVQRSGGQPVQMAIIDRHVGNLYRYRDQLVISLDVLNRKKEDVIKLYTEIRREVKTIEHLKDKKKREYMGCYYQSQAKEADEMASLRFIRERTTG